MRAARAQRGDPRAAVPAEVSAADLLGSLAVTDIQELARRQGTYVAHRRAEGFSEGVARVWNAPLPRLCRLHGAALCCGDIAGGEGDTEWRGGLSCCGNSTACGLMFTRSMFVGSWGD